MKYTKYILSMLSILMLGCAQKKIPHLHTPSNNKINNSENKEDFVEKLYGKNSINLDLEKIFLIQDLIQKLENISETMQQEIAITTIKLLKKSLQEKTELTQAIYIYIIHYLEQFIHHETDQTKQDPLITEIAQKIVDYIDIEQTDIFSNEKSRYLFIHCLTRISEEKTTQLPALINFWSNEQGQKIINNYTTSDPVKIQGFIASIMIDMSVMLAAQTGASMANAAVSTELQQLATLINKNSQTVQTNIQTFQTQIQTKQQEKLQAMITAFSQAQQNAQSQVSQAGKILNLELDYLYKNISLEQPQQNYIFNQIQYDQLFTLGTMFTPQGALWKNPFSMGDWEYEPTSNSFWQYQNSPLLYTKTDADGNKTTSSLQAENNSIFGEYFTQKQSYTIAGSITIYALNYPFFVGIMFNKARWISGDFESIRKCRMIGIYGTSEQNYNIYFAEQYTMTDEQIQASPLENPIQTPLQQIINNKVNPSLTIPQDTFANLSTTPVIINFSITNSPTSVTLHFSIGTHTSTPITINKLDSKMYLYHNIGFICPGAIAEFKLSQPTDFIFSQQAISNYKELT